ncbi:MAG: hypothetical protein U9O98_00740 [Asgard group archaeon]|nr:hypothetical protein [Asgard group archaeon]
MAKSKTSRFDSSKTKIDLPKPEFIEGEIDFPEMIRKDYRKALTIIALTLITTLIVTGGLWAIAYFL